MNINLTLFGQMISFAVFVWFTIKYVWPPIMQALQEREKKIAEGLAAADRGKHDQILAAEKAKEVLHEAKTGAADILSQAQKRAAVIVEEAKKDARTEGERLLHAARAEIDHELNRAREQLREQVAGLVVAGAQKVLEKEIDASAHRDILKTIANQI